MENLIDYHSPELNPTEQLIEMAARRHHNADLAPGQYDWDQIIARSDSRVEFLRNCMLAALKEILVVPAEWRPTNWTFMQDPEIWRRGSL